jgi:hypothetical protein
MTDELNYGAISVNALDAMRDRSRIAVLKEAIERADQLATVHAQLIATQEQLIQDLRTRIKTLESDNSELRTAVGGWVGSSST